MKIFPLHRTAIAALLATSVAMPALAETAAERMTVGAELIYGRREIASGASDDASRLQTSVQFNF